MSNFSKTRNVITLQPAFTLFEYQYRDGANYKSWGELLLIGACSSSDVDVIRKCCEWNSAFVAEQVGVPTLYAELYAFSGGPTEDDHVYHEFFGLRNATLDESLAMRAHANVSDIVEKFRAASGKWDGSLSPHWDL